MINVALVDLDGTVYTGNVLLPEADKAITHLRMSGIKVFFCTNNSSKTPKNIINKLKQMGISCEESEIISSGKIAIDYILSNNFKKVYINGTREFIEECSYQGVDVVDAEHAETLLIAMDPNYNYNKMTQAVRVALKASKIIVCNKDKLYPTDNGLAPGCGAIVSSILDPVNRTEDILIGKPSTVMIEYVSKITGCSAKELVVIGDMIDSDEQMAKSFGAKSYIIGKDISSFGDTIAWEWKNIE